MSPGDSFLQDRFTVDLRYGVSVPETIGNLVQVSGSLTGSLPHRRLPLAFA